MKKSLFGVALKDSFGYFIPFIERSWGVLIALFLFSEIFQHYFLAIKRLTMNTESMNAPAMAGMLLCSLFEFVALTMLVPMKIMELEGAPRGTFMAFSKRHLHALTVESLRALAMTLLWMMAFILPGIFKYLRYFFVPFVVVADPAYEKGQVDALERSDALVKGYTFQLFVIVVVLTVAELWRGHYREIYPLASETKHAIGAGLAFFALNIFTNILLFRVYQLRMKGLVVKPAPAEA